MFPVYATPADLAAAPWYLTLPQQDAERLLSYASRWVRMATRTAIYTADAVTGLPTDGALANALRDATCAQVASWSALSIDPAKGAADGGKTVQGKSLGSASVQYAVDASAASARAASATRLGQDAYLILEDAGLVGTSPIVYG